MKQQQVEIIQNEAQYLVGVGGNGAGMQFAWQLQGIVRLRHFALVNVALHWDWHEVLSLTLRGSLVQSARFEGLTHDSGTTSRRLTMSLRHVAWRGLGGKCVCVGSHLGEQESCVCTRGASHKGVLHNCETKVRYKCL